MVKFLTEFEESIRIALEQISAHKMRSLLTALGVIIGTFAITMMGTLMKGVDKGFTDSLNMLGTDTFYVERWPWRNVGDDWPRYRNRPQIRSEHADALNELIADTPNSKLMIAVPCVVSWERIERRDLDVSNIQTIGTTADFPLVTPANIEFGRFFAVHEALVGRNLIILGYDVATALFPEGNETALGEMVRIRGIRFEVIGVLSRQGNFLGMQSFDSQALMSIPALRKFYSGDWRNHIRVLKHPDASLDQAEDEIVGHMRRIRGVMPGRDNDFEVNQSRAIEEQIGPVKRTIALAGFFITGLALFVGAIGIMNITFVSVKERTREIGTRRALGARRRTILLQFLIEAVSICMMGGLVGLVLSYGAKQAMQTALPNFPVVFTFDLVIIAALISVLTGIASGFAPAWQAARMDPAESLRHE
jgi:putative ABC transport system permease protein